MAFEKNSNKFPMKEYHIQHMEKTILRFVMGLPENSSKLEKRNYEKYFGRLTYVCKEIEYDILHGAMEISIGLQLGKCTKFWNEVTIFSNGKSHLST